MQFFQGKKELEIVESQKVTRKETNIAIAVLLWEIAYIDLHIHDAELGTIVESLTRKRGLSKEESEELISLAKDIKKLQPELENFLRAIEKHCDLEEKKNILRMAFHVALADDLLHSSERVLIKLIASRLNIEEQIEDEDVSKDDNNIFDKL